MLEEILPAIKFSYSFLAQESAKDLVSCANMSWPRHLEPSRANYEQEIKDLKRLARANPQKRYLSIQFFASHGYLIDGTTWVATNRHDAANKFYELIKAEAYIR